MSPQNMAKHMIPRTKARGRPWRHGDARGVHAELCHGGVEAEDDRFFLDSVGSEVKWTMKNYL